MSENQQNDQSPSYAETVQWLSVPEAAERLGVRDRDVRSMLRDDRLLGVRRAEGKGPQIPAQMIVEIDGVPQVLPSLHGTIVQLKDCGLDEEQSMQWLLSHEEEIGQAPLQALIDERTHVVRRVARTLLL